MYSNRIGRYTDILKEKLEKRLQTPFQKLLKTSDIDEAVENHNIKFRERVYSPVITFYAFLAQVLGSDRSCRRTVSQLLAFLCGLEKNNISNDTGAYCKARKRFSEKVIQWIFYRVRDRFEDMAEDDFLWKNRSVKVFDGSSVSMPDTPKNQKAYQQPTSQKKGCGFPVARIVVMFSLVTGAVLDLKISSLKKGERSLFRKFFNAMRPGDIALGDRGFCSYADIALLYRKQVDVVFRLFGRKHDFREGKRLGKNDRLVTWDRPVQRPPGLLKTLFRKVPPCLTVRLVRFQVTEKGHRTREITLVTTLLDPKEYTLEDLAELYCMRWQAEVNLRHIKISMGMDVLRCKTPDMVRKEIWMHLIAYNLVRGVMWEAGVAHKKQPLSLSVKGSIQHIQSFSAAFENVSLKRLKTGRVELQSIISREVIPSRPGRIEPRVKKRRPKSYGWMKEPRKVLRRKSVAA